MICLILTLCLLAGCGIAVAESPELTENERKALETLSESLEKDAVRQIAAIGEVPDFYSELPSAGAADTDSFPEKFDLRERGIVTPVKSQIPWGTCWTFGTSAACETSLLSMLGLTTEGYKEKFGVDMDISERHLAWFTAVPLPEVSDYPEGEYPYDASQAGEGCRTREEVPPLMAGGSFMMKTKARQLMKRAPAARKNDARIPNQPASTPPISGPITLPAVSAPCIMPMQTPSFWGGA